MSDRSWVKFYFPALQTATPDGARALQRTLAESDLSGCELEPANTAHPGVARLSIEGEAAGGGEDISGRLIAEGIPFVRVWDGYTAVYECGISAFDGETYIEFSAGEGGYPALTAKKGVLTVEAIETFQGELEHYRKVCAMVGRSP